MRRKSRKQLTSTIMLMISTLAIGCVFYGLLREGRIFTANAEELSETTPASLLVSPADTVSPTDAEEQIIASETVELIPHADPALSLIPYSMTHLLNVDGHLYRTANPNNGGSGKVTSYYHDSETGSNVTYVENSFPFNQDTATGNLAYGCDFVIDLSGSRYDNRGLNCAEADGYGYVTVTCTDGTSVRWNASSKDKYTSGWNSIQRYYFTWSMLEEALDGKTPQSAAINAEEGIPSPYPMGIFRHSTDSQLTLESLHPDSVYGLFYDAEACEYGSGYDYIQNWKLDDTIRVADSTLSFPSGYNSSALSCSVHGTMQFYITENNPGKRITGVNVSGPGTAAYDETAGKWLVTCNSTNPYFIDVQEENVTGSSSYRLDVEATSTDYSMNGIQISDNFNGSSFYSSYKPTRHYFSTFPMNMRFSDAACTSAYGPGEGGKTRSGSNQVKVTNYHRNENLDNWYATIIAYGAEGVTGYNTSTGGPRTVKIENVSFLNEDTGETLNISYSTGMKGYSPFISFLPPACNLKVTLDVKYTDERVNIHLHETRPTNLDTAWASYFSRCQILVPGDDNKLATQKTYHYGHGNDPNNYNLGTDLDWYENIGTFLSGHSFNYGLYYCNGFSSFVTMVKEWHIYPADADGKKIEGAAPIDHIFNYTYPPTTDADYVN